MCGQYRVIAIATRATTEYIFIELLPPSGVQIAIKRIRLTDIGTVIDDPYTLKVYRETTAGSGGVSFTPMKLDPESPAAVTTAQIKNVSTAFTLGTTTDVLISFGVNTRGSYEWIARDNDDYLWSGEGERLIITLGSNAAASNTCVECDFIE